jgi:hypothetical protein
MHATNHQTTSFFTQIEEVRVIRQVALPSASSENRTPFVLWLEVLQQPFARFANESHTVQPVRPAISAARGFDYQMENVGNRKAVLAAR